MEQTRFIKTIIRHARYFLIALFLALPSIVHAAPAQFFYDDLGRLNSVIDETGNGVTYNYDAVGNLLSIVPIGPPTITSVTPSILDAGRSVEVTIAGNGLVGTLTTSNPEIVISKADAMSTSLIATLTIPNPTTFGTTTLTVNTPKGSASINITVRQLLPTITSLTPSSGVAGDTVVIQGQNLGTKTGSNQVTFSGPGGARLVASILNESLTRITTIAPAGVEPGPVTVDVGGLTSNGLLFEPLTLTGIVATATQGTPADTTLPSANIDQSIGLQGSLFTSGMKVIFSTINSNGVTGTLLISPSSVSLDGLSATVSVPMETTTGPVTLKDSLSTRETAPLQLQIVPDLLSFRVPPGELFNPGTVLTLSGSGFKEGNTTITFTGAASPVSATDVLQGNTGLSVVIPPGATGGPISVNTDGGVSEPVLGNTAALIGIVSTAVQGVPTDPIQASANIGQSVTLNGSGLTSLTYIFFTSFDFNGSLISTLDLPDSVAPDGQSLTILLPPGAISGLITVADHDTGLGSGSVNLQIVPTVDTLSGSLNAGSLLQVGGNGFEANTTQIQFPGVPLPVNPDNLSIDHRQLFFPAVLLAMMSVQVIYRVNRLILIKRSQPFCFFFDFRLKYF